MQAVLDFFSALSSLQKFLWIVFCLLLFWILESLFPLFQLNYKKTKHAQINLILLFSTILINAFFGIITAGVFVWISNHHFGLLNMVNLPLGVQLITSILFLDLVAQYFVHFLLHKVKFMWKLHMVHHSDTHVDATTGTRHHPGDYIFREVFSLIAIVVAGIPFGFYMLYKITTVFFTYFTHANIHLPYVVDKAMSYIFISPNMHKFHHHFERPWTDSNFGNIFSFWDRIFGTFVYNDTTNIKYGLDVLPDNTSSSLLYQLKIPFNNNIKTDY